MDLVDRVYALFYSRFVKLHLSQRESAVVDALTSISVNLNLQVDRFIDFGCGEGFLAKRVNSLGLRYLGIDKNEKLANLSQMAIEDFKNAVVVCGSVDELSDKIKGSDVVCLNGVAHHLNDELMSQLISMSKKAGALIILDHQKSKNYFDVIPRLLQALDFGKFIREESYFDFLPGFKVETKVQFTISLLGIKCWPMLCYVYTPYECE